MNNLKNKINQLYKLASQSQLDALLQVALNGDKESYLIFLDLLEEIKPRMKESLSEDIHLGLKLHLLQRICPNVISNVQDNLQTIYPIYNFDALGLTSISVLDGNPYSRVITKNFDIYWLKNNLKAGRLHINNEVFYLSDNDNYRYDVGRTYHYLENDDLEDAFKLFNKTKEIAQSIINKLKDILLVKDS